MLSLYHSIDLCIYCSELVVWLYAFAFMFLMQQQLFGWNKCKCLVPGSINTTSQAGNLLRFKQNNNRRNKGKSFSLIIRLDNMNLCVRPSASIWGLTLILFALTPDLPGGYDALAVTKLAPCVSCHQRNVHRSGLTSVPWTSLCRTTHPLGYPLTFPWWTLTEWYHGWLFQCLPSYSCQPPWWRCHLGYLQCQ